MRRLDWSATAVGSPHTWPDNLRAALRICLTSRFPMHVWWGKALTLFYNDACISFLGKGKHPAVLGRPGRQAWAEIWPSLGPMIDGVLATRQATWSEDIPMFVDRAVEREEVYATFSFSPVLGSQGQVDGLFCASLDTTEKVVGNRRNETLRRLGLRSFAARTSETACQTSAEVLAANPRDLPFAAIYLLADDHRRARLVASVGLTGGSPLPAEVALGTPARADRWRVAAVAASGRAQSIDNLPRQRVRIRGGPWPEPTRKALVLPIPGKDGPDDGELAGVLVAGLSPRLSADERYRSFLEMVAGQIGVAVRLARQRHLAADNAALVRLHELSGDLLGQGALPEILQAALDAAVALAGAQMGTLQLHDAQSNVLQIVAQSGFDEAFFEFFKIVRANAPSVCGEALRRRRRVIVADTAGDPKLRRSSEGDVLAGAGVAAVQSTPILARDGSVLGMMSTHWRAPHRPAEVTLRLIDLLVHQLGGLIEHRRAAEALHRTEAALRDADRRKDEFISILSHELRNPLAPITTAVQLMRMHGDKPSTAELDLIDRQARHLTRLVDDLLDATRLTRGRVTLQRRPLRIRDIVARGVEMALPLIEERRHRLDMRAPSGALRVMGDEDRLAQIVGNLLTNAAKYTDPGGVISVRTRREGDRVAIQIEDNGVGIAADLLPHVFDLFVQARQPTDRARGGLGIGLAIVRSLTELHGGDVLAESAGAGRGALFTVRLPAAPEASPPLEEAAPATVAARRRHLRILLVDDNPDIVQPLARLLQKFGHDVRTAGDGPSALEVVRTFSAEIAVVDIGLPVMDGYTLASRMLAQLGKAAPRLIALTGYGQATDRARSAKAGFALHMTKPIDPLALIRAIERPTSGS